jgi:hypothetical protein
VAGGFAGGFTHSTTSQGLTDGRINIGSAFTEGLYGAGTAGALHGAGTAVRGVRGTRAPAAAKTATTAETGRTEIVERAMSRAELEATRRTGLVRGGREGTHYVSDNVNRGALRARQRLSLPQTPEVRVTLEVPEGAFSPSKFVDPDYMMPGGGMERAGSGPISCRVLAVQEYC